MMKWPERLDFMRHGVSAYNALVKEKKNGPAYRAFIEAWEHEPHSDETRRLAILAKNEIFLGIGDWSTPLQPEHVDDAIRTGVGLRHSDTPVPHIIFASPYRRTLDTLEAVREGWPEIRDVPVVKDERLRERENGIKLLYPDRQIFDALFPDQAQLRKLEGDYWYRPPQGENIPDVRMRTHAWVSTLIREFAGKRVFSVVHHVLILSARATLERWDAEKYIDMDEHHKPSNCGVTRYRGNPALGSDGKLELEFYNRIFH